MSSDATLSPPLLMSNPAPAAETAAPKKSNRMLLIIVAVLVLAGGGGGGYWWFVMKPAAAAATAEAEPEEPAEPPAMVNFDPFVVNLADPGGQRFLRVTFGLVVEGEEAAKHFEEEEVVRLKVRSAVLELLSQQMAAHLVTAEGKAELKKSLIEHATHNAEHLKVNDVLFSEFIVQ